MIPRILHQIWIGPDPLPAQLEEYQRTWRRHHPQWEFRFWTEENLPEDLRRREVYDRLRSPVERSDILRLELVWREGGVYVDTDFECLRPLDPLLDGRDLLLAYAKEGRVNNAVVGGAAAHPLLERALSEVRPREEYGYDKDAAGPGLLTRLVASEPGLAILEPELFFPRTPAEQAGAYAVHHQARSWKDAETLRGDLARVEARLGYTRDELRTLAARYEASLAELEALRARLRGERLAALRALAHRLNRVAVPRETAARVRRRLRRRG